MRLAVAGKGGAGKTTISATLARVLARSGRSVVAVDADANPNLSVALGVAPDVASGLRPIPSSLVSWPSRTTGRWKRCTGWPRSSPSCR